MRGMWCAAIATRSQGKSFPNAVFASGFARFMPLQPAAAARSTPLRGSGPWPGRFGFERPLSRMKHGRHEGLRIYLKVISFALARMVHIRFLAGDALGAPPSASVVASLIFSAAWSAPSLQAVVFLSRPLAHSRCNAPPSARGSLRLVVF